MKTYQVHFSFYDEENGRFDEAQYKVDAQDPFAARRMAWGLRDTDEHARLQSCAQICGVTWDASPLDLQDFFNAKAAYDKYCIAFTKNVDRNNAEIRQDDEAKKEADARRAYIFGSLDSGYLAANSLGRPFGMIPPVVYEEIEYARQLVSKLDEMGRHDAAESLMGRVEEAEAWDLPSIYDLRELFSQGSIHLPGDYINFTQFFGRDGIYPEHADTGDRESTYIHRWMSARHIDRLPLLPIFSEKHIIAGGDSLAYDYKVLVLRANVLDEGLRKPENLLWTPDNDGLAALYLEPGKDARNDYVRARNMITGLCEDRRRSDFLGILRPDIADNIDFAALAREYAAGRNECRQFRSEESSAFAPDMGDDWEQRDD